MSKKQFGYIGAAPNQSFGDNKGIFTPQDIIELDEENKWTNFGQLELIQTQVASNVTNLDFTNIQEDVFNVHLVTFEDIQWGTADSFYCRLSDDGGVSFESSSNHDKAQQYGSASGSFGVSTRSNHDRWDRILQNQANNPHTGYLYIYNLGDSTKYSHATMLTNNWSSGNYQFKFGSHVYKVTSKINALRFFTSTHAWSGTISLYGIRFS